MYKIGPKAEAADTGKRTQAISQSRKSLLSLPLQAYVNPLPLLRLLVWKSNPVGTHWRNVDLSAWDFPKAPFKRIHDKLAIFQTQYYQMEHTTRGANMALDNCGPKNILR